MDESEFKRLLNLFPVVRSRNYHPDLDAKESTSRSPKDELIDWQDAWSQGADIPGINYNDPFWGKLKLAAEKKVNPEAAERFCKAFQTVYEKLVHKELSVDAARSYISSATNLTG